MIYGILHLAAVVGRWDCCGSWIAARTWTSSSAVWKVSPAVQLATSLTFCINWKTYLWHYNSSQVLTRKSETKQK